MYLDTAVSLPPRPVSPPAELLPPWRAAQLVAERHAKIPLPPVAMLRARGALSHERAARIAEWYAGPFTARARDVRVSYDALAHDLATLGRAVTAPRRDGGLGVAVTLVAGVDEPYATAAELCTDLRRHGTMKLRAAAAEPHPVLSDAAFDQLRLVHDVLGHAAIGLGFDLQSEYAAWLYCRPLFSRTARPAAFCQLVGAVTAYVLTEVKPGLRADLPPAGL
jgi:hypothetical protein